MDISGSDTSLAQIAAEVLGLEMEQVIVAKRDTDLAPFTGPSGGSRIVYSQGRAVQMAAEDARDKLMAPCRRPPRRAGRRAGSARAARSTSWTTRLSPSAWDSSPV